MLQLLVDGDSASLAGWLADPLSAADAAAWRAHIHIQLRARHGGGRPPFAVRLAEIIVRYWCGEQIAMHHENLLAVLDADRPRAQLELCYGQLLIARKRRSAWQHLDAGFALATHLLAPEDYFVVLGRHACLRHLPLSERGAEPAGLEELLREAAVIARLSGPIARSGSDGPPQADTVG